MSTVTSNPNENGAAAVQTGWDVTGIDAGVIGVAASRPRTLAQGFLGNLKQRLAAARSDADNHTRRGETL